MENAKQTFIKGFNTAAIKSNFQSEYNWAEAMWADYVQEREFKEKFAWGQRDFMAEGECAFEENQKILKEI